MKVLIVSPFFPFPEDSGSKIRLASLIKSLQGYDLFLIAFRERGEAIDEEKMRGACREFHVFERPRIGPFREWLNHFSTRPMLIRRFFAAAALRKTWEIVRDEKVDLLVIETLLMAKYALRTPGLRLVLDEHNLEFARAASRLAATRGLGSRLYNYLIMRRLRRFELRVIRGCDRCLVCSEEDARTLAGRTRDGAVVVVPNVVDTDHFAPRPAISGGRKIVFSGTLWYEPNRDAVLWFAGEILPLLRARGMGAELMVIGPGPSRDVAALAQQGDVTVSGYVDDIRPHLAGAALAVAPIRMGSGTRFKILTAMAMGLPVVSTSLGMQGIDARDGESICVADGPEAFGDRVCRLLTDPAFSRRIGRGGRELVESRYSLRATLPGLRALWDGIAAGGRP